MPEAPVGAEADRHRLVAAVHRHEVDVHVDEEVRLGRAAVDLDVLALLGDAKVDEVRGVLGVVVRKGVGVERAEDALTDGPLDLGGRHAPVERVRHDQPHVVHAGARRELQDVFDHAPADVGRLHRRERQRDVVERDRQAHPGVQQLRERVGGDGVQQRVLDGGVHVADPGQRVGRVDHLGAEREALDAEPLAGVHEERRGAFVDLQDEAGSAHWILSSSPFSGRTRP